MSAAPIAEPYGLPTLFRDDMHDRRTDGGLELSAKVAQDRLGHSSISMTLDTYGHLFPRGNDGAELEAAERASLGRAVSHDPATWARKACRMLQAVSHGTAVAPCNPL